MFRRTMLPASSGLEMEVELEYYHISARRHSPEDRESNLRSRESLKSFIQKNSHSDNLYTPLELCIQNIARFI